MKRIKFDTSILAKEVGFELQNTKGLYWVDGRFDCEETYLFYSDVAFPAPYQGEIQEWLRNEHLIEVFSLPQDKSVCDPLPLYFTAIWGYNTGNIIEQYNSSLPDATLHFGSYEEALEFGIKEALKMIK